MMNGSATITPPAYGELIETFRRGDVAAGSKALSEVWPDVCLLIDRKALDEGNGAFPLDEKQLKGEWTLVAEDSGYALYEPVLKPSAPLVIRKRIRTDLAKRYRRLHFKARMTFVDSGLEPHVQVEWNGRGTRDYALTSEFQPLEFDGQERWLGRPEGDVLTISLVFKVGDETALTPADEALAGKGVEDVWEIIELELWEAPRR